jgi:CubicO group peptidase (beta-lactamase class C family)
VTVLFVALLGITQGAIWVGSAVNAKRAIPIQQGRKPESRDPRVDPASLDAFIQSNMQRTGVPGVALAVVKNERVAYTAGYGTLSNGEAIGPATPMFIASLSKSVTAAATLQLIEAGKLALATPLSQALPDLHFIDARLARVTVEQLLNQSSGIDCNSSAVRNATTSRTLAEALSQMATLKLSDQPGASWRYCNANYHLLAAIDERISGESFADYLQRAIFAPLGMSQTKSLMHLRDGKQPAGHTLAYGYALEHENPDELAVGASGIVSTAEDLVKWLVLQLQADRSEGGERVIGLSPMSIDQMHTPTAPNSNYGFGWRADLMLDGREYVFHSGRVVAHSAHAALYPANRYGYILMWNSLHPLGAEQRSFIEGMNNLLAGQTPDLGRPVGRIVDSMLAAFTVLWATIGIVGALGAPRWVVEASNEPIRRTSSMLGYGLVALGVLLLPIWSSAVFNQRLSIWSLFEIWPAVGLLLATTGVTSLIIVVLRGRAMLKR